MFKSIILSLVAMFVVAGLTFAQDLVVQGTASFTGTGKYTVKGNITNAGVSSAKKITGNVQLAKNGAQSVGNSGQGPINFDTLVVVGSGTKTTAVNDSVQGLLDVANASGTFDIGANTLELQDAITNTGAAASPYAFSTSGSEVRYSKVSGNQSIFGTTYDKVTANGVSTFDLQGNVTANNTVSHTGGSMSITNNFNANGAYSFATISDITTAKALTLSATGGSIATLTDAHGNIVNGSGTLTVTTLTNNHGIVTAAANNGPMSFVNPATNSGVILGGNGLVEFKDKLTTSDSLLAGLKMQFDSLVTNSGGIAANATDTLNFKYNIANTGRIELVGSGYAYMMGSFSSVGTVNLATASTWNYDGASQSIAGAASGVTYGNLLTTGSGTKTALGNVTLTGNFDNGGPGDLAITTDMSTYTLSIGGTRDNTNSTMLFGGTNNGLLFTSGTVNYDASSGTQLVAGDATNNYSLLIFSNGGTKQIAAGVRVGTASNLTINPSVIADVNAATSQLIVLGNLINGGTLNNAGTVQVGN
jgi:hypothetical protein